MPIRALIRTVRAAPANLVAAPRPATIGSVLFPAIRRAIEGAPTAPLERTDGRIVVASYNVHKCVGTDGRFDPERVATVIGELDVDVLALQEADQRFGERSGLLDRSALEERTGLTFLPVAARARSHGWHGNAILVREGRATRIERIKLPGAEPRGAVLAEIELPGGRLRVVAAHFGLLRHSRRQQADAILRLLGDGEDMPTLLMGDLNEWSVSRTRSVLTSLEPFFGPCPAHHPSFPARLPVLALDRILGSPRGTVEAVSVHMSPLARVASDHLPIKARVNLARPAYAVGIVDAA
jgi:endonuclease/exonuclease/phosphatase family metal-dependent hydrolase